MLMMLLIAVLVIYFVEDNRHYNFFNDENKALRILDVRLINGEIDGKEYELKKDLLNK